MKLVKYDEKREFWAVNEDGLRPRRLFGALRVEIDEICWNLRIFDHKDYVRGAFKRHMMDDVWKRVVSMWKREFWGVNVHLDLL